MPSPTPPAGGGRNLSMILSTVAVILSVIALSVSFAIPGPAGATGANGVAGTQGPQGPQGPAGADFTITTTLKSGQNETGDYAAFGSANGTTTNMAADVNFRIPLSKGLPIANLTLIYAGSPYSIACPGPGRAAAGHLCVYETSGGGRALVAAPYDPAGPGGEVEYGFILFFSVEAASGYSYGSWTVTAP